MTFIYAISFMVIPFMTSFIVFNYDDVKLDEISPIIYKFYYIDIFINLITGVYDKSKKNTTFNQKVIFQFVFILVYSYKVYKLLGFL